MNKDKLVKLLEFDSLGHQQVLTTDDYAEMLEQDDIVISSGVDVEPVGKKYVVSVLPTESEMDGILADWEAILAADGNRASGLTYGLSVFFETDSLRIMQRMINNVLGAESDQIAEILSLDEGGVVFNFMELRQDDRTGDDYYDVVATVAGDRHSVETKANANMEWLNENYWSLFGITLEYLDLDNLGNETIEEQQPTKVHLA